MTDPKNELTTQGGSTTDPSGSSGNYRGAGQQIQPRVPPRYEILERAGEGGMGIVYRARHRELDTYVAVKELRGGMSLEQFRREAKSLVKIRSPFVVGVHDFCIQPDGPPIMVMEWVEGRDLKKTMQAFGGRIPEPQALTWMRQVCEGMIAASDVGIIHRDLKPSNILIDNLGNAKVGDFGLARLRDGLGDTPVHDADAVVGTAFYMAPEQAENPRSADARSDVYSFGATFYHVLTGVPPFEGATYFDVILRHKLDPVMSPKSRCPEISEATSQLLERCLAKSPNDRFQNFTELLDHLSQSGSELAWTGAVEGALTPSYAVFRKRFDDYMAARIHEEGDLYELRGNRSLRIVYDNITNREADAIVSSDNSHLTMKYGVSLAIKWAAGEKVFEEAQQRVPVRPGRAVVTSAGKLKARFVFHGVTIGWNDEERLTPSRDLIVEVMKSCFYHADTLNVQRIAFPLLGTGAAGFSRAICLDTMFRFLARTLYHGLTSVTSATLVLYGRPALISPSARLPQGPNAF